ncbi:hypothetical protein JCM10207_006092 [Rhodosporidiobolus poonsookiae]
MLSTCLPSLFASPPPPPPAMSSLSSSSVSLLILGAGWTSTFLIPHLRTSHPSLTYAATTRDGRDGTIAWAFDPEGGAEQFEKLPRAETVLVVFPIRGLGGSKTLVEGYEQAVGGRVRWIQLGSTGIWDGGPTLAALRSSSSDPEKLAHAPPLKWTDRHSPYDKTNTRAMAEDELLSLHEETYVLNLAGLWGSTRNPANWIPRIATSFEALEAKGSLHLIHGEDVSRAVVAVHLSPPRACNLAPEKEKEEMLVDVGGEGEKTTEREGRKQKGERFLLTDLRVYCWWDLVAAWAPSSPSTSSSPSSSSQHVPTPSPSIAASPTTEHTPLAAHWVQQLMLKHNVRALPRSPEELGRAMDSREFWSRFRLMPARGRFERDRA